MESAVMEAVRMVRDSVKNPTPAPVRLGRVHRVGEYVRQGDVYVTISDLKTEGLKKIEAFNGQLAPGETRGSRHCVDPTKVVAFEHPKAGTDVQFGPVIRALEDCKIDHPDHGRVDLEKDCLYEITYQVNYFEQQRQRVRD